MFRIRSQSLRKKYLKKSHQYEENPHGHYACLHVEQTITKQWNKILKSELNLQSTVIVFQMAQYGGRNDNKRRLAMRRINILKNTIISLITHCEVQNFQSYLQELKTISPQNAKLTQIYLEFYHIRQLLIQNEYEYKAENMQKLRNFLQNSNLIPQKQNQSMIYTRIMYIYALHLLKLQKVFITSEEILLISRAMSEKKKELVFRNQINKELLESLLFSTYNFYKILHLLKKDQDKLISYYNQIQAYINIYKTKLKNFQQFEGIFHIEKNIKELTPLNLNIKIYNDFERRKVLSIQCTESQILKNHQRKFTTNTKISGKRKQTMMVEEQNMEEDSNFFLSKLCEDILINPGINQVGAEAFSFIFLVPTFLKIYIGTFRVVFSQNYQQFTINIFLSLPQTFVASFILTLPVSNTHKLNQFCKKLWNILKICLEQDKPQISPTLFTFDSPSQKFIPKAVDNHFGLPILIRIHSIILEYFRQSSIKQKQNGSVFNLPKIKKDQILKQISKNQESQKRIFSKRQGFISENKKIETRNTKQTIGNILILKIKNNTFNIIYLSFRKGQLEDVLIMEKDSFSVSEDQEHVQMLNNISMMSKFTHGRTNKRVKQIIIERMLAPFKKEDRFDDKKRLLSKKSAHKKRETIEQQYDNLEITMLDSWKGKVRDYWHHSRSKAVTHVQEKKIIKAQNGRLWLTTTHKFSNYIRYYDGIEQLYQPQEKQLISFHLCYIKLRLYRTFVYKSSSTHRKYCQYKSANILQSCSLLRKHQQSVTLSSVYTFVRRFHKKYSILNFYTSKSDDYIMEIYIFGCQELYYAIINEIILKEAQDKKTQHWDLNLERLEFNTEIKLTPMKMEHSHILSTAQLYYQSIR